MRGLYMRGGGGSVLTCCIATAIELSPLNGSRPVSVSYSVTPSE